jgi:Zn-dependent protease
MATDTTFQIFVLVPIVILSVVIHEYCHGYAAYLLGDNTAKNMGRLTLNPIVSIDPVGTIIVPIITTLFLHMPFGWAKGVPINPLNFRNPVKGMAISGFAGPLSNLVIIFVFGMIIRLIEALGITLPGRMGDMLAAIVLINLILSALNLIPIPPLDGSRILVAILPHDLRVPYMRIEPFGFVIIIALGYVGILWSIMFPIMKLISVILFVPASVLSG